MTASKLWSLLVIATLSLFVSGTPLERDEPQEFNEFGRIVNGRQAEIGELPYQVSIQYIHSNNFHFCGGTKIADEWVLTAAHCMRNQDKDNLRVVAGATSLDDSMNPVYAVVKIISHQYDNHKKTGDLALMKIEPMELHENARTTHPMSNMDLNPHDFDPTGLFCNVSGWGHLQAGSAGAPRDLQVVSVEMVSKKGCKEMLGEDLPWDENAMVCAGGRTTDACQGDSGGPLVCEDPKTNNKYLSGIVSWGVGCATEGIPGVYTNVMTYRNWILQTMREN